MLVDIRPSIWEVKVLRTPGVTVSEGEVKRDVYHVVCGLIDCGHFSPSPTLPQRSPVHISHERCHTLVSAVV